MMLHEYYFGNLKKGGGGDPDCESAFFKAVESSFGSYEIWKADFIGVGKKRGGLGNLLSRPPRSALEPLDHTPSDRQRHGV